MGRPPLYPDSGGATSNTSNKTWQPPLWLTGERQARRSQFTVPLPAVPSDVYQAVAASITKHQAPFHKEQQQINSAKAKLQDQRDKVEACREKINALEQAKERGLRDIREMREEETQAALESIEKKMRSKHEKEIKEKRMEWKRGIEEECDAKRKRMRKEQEEQTEKEKAPVDTSNTAKEEELDESARDSISSSIVEKPKEELASEIKKKELAELKAKLDKLTEDRSEIVWLLKQAIKAEEKQKPKSSSVDRKPEAKISTSKQA